jgi:hypothetical protein
MELTSVTILVGSFHKQRCFLSRQISISQQYQSVNSIFLSENKHQPPTTSQPNKVGPVMWLFGRQPTILLFIKKGTFVSHQINTNHLTPTTSIFKSLLF